MPRHSTGRHRVGSFVNRARYGGTSGGTSIPEIALNLIDGEWFVNDANTETPDGYFIQVGDEIFIDDTASSGLDISIIDGEIFVTI